MKGVTGNGTGVDRLDSGPVTPPLLAIGVSPGCSLRRLSETAGGHLAAAGHQ
jgi:hypothetical protein